MSTVRYFSGIAFAVLAFIAVLIMDLGEGFMTKLGVAYVIAATVAELVWWDSIGVRVSFFLLKFTGTVFLFWFGILFSNIIFFIIAIAIATPVFGFMASVLGAAATVLLGLSAIFFPIHIFTRAGDLY